MNMSFLSNVVGPGVVSVLTALILGLIAFMVAPFAQEMTVKFCSRWQEKIGDGVQVLGQLAYLIVLLLFAPGIFERLGAGSITSPILHTMQRLFGFIPDLIGAILILAIGSCVAKMVKNIMTPILVRTKMDTLLQKVGIQTDVKLSDTIAYLLYVLIMIPIAIAALEVLHIRSLTQPAVMVLNKCLLFIPNIVAALILFSIGMLLAKFMAHLVVKMVSVSGVDEKIIQMIGKDSFKLSKFLGVLVNIVITLFFLVESLHILHLSMLTHIVETIIRYLPNMASAIVICLLAFFGATMIKNALSKNHMECVGKMCQYIIYVLASIMVLSQLRIGTHIIEPLFRSLVMGLSVAFALAFGLGGKKFAEETLDKISHSNCGKDCICEDVNVKCSCKKEDEPVVEVRDPELFEFEPAVTAQDSTDDNRVVDAPQEDTLDTAEPVDTKSVPLFDEATDADKSSEEQPKGIMDDFGK